MRHFYTFLLLLFFIPVLSYAQSNYKPGYVVNLKGDTLHGYIDYKEWGVNPGKVAFKYQNNTIESITCENAIAFGVNDFEYYKRFTVRISRDQVTIGNIKQGIDTSYTISTVFLNVLSTGKNVSLYSYTDEIKTRYYVADNTGQPNELVYHVYYAADNSSYIETQTRYIDQLRYLAGKYNIDDNKFESEILNAKYTSGDLVKAVQLINGNSGRRFTSKSVGGARWYIGAGITDNIMRFKGTIQFAKGGGSFSPEVSAGLDLIPNKNIQKVFIRFDFSLTAHEYSFSNSPNNDLNFYYTLNNVKQRTLSVTPQIGYNFYNTGPLKIFIAGGVSFNASTYNNYYFKQYYTNTGLSGVETITYKFPSLVGFWESFPFKAGILLNKKIEVYAGYAFSAPLTNNNNYIGNIATYEAGIKYLLDIK